MNLNKKCLDDKILVQVPERADVYLCAGEYHLTS